MTLSGLAVEEAQQRLCELGLNELPEPTRTSVWARVLVQLRDPLVLVLQGAIVLTIVTGDLADSVVIAFVVLANTTVGVVQEVRADHAVTALATMTVPSARVRRSGLEMSIPSTDLVPGDIALLAEGDVVPADGDVVEAASLLVDESALTGESVPVAVGPRDEDMLGGEVSAGTVVVKGRAVIEVTRTGSRSALGRIAALTSVRAGPTPLQRRMAQLGGLLATTAIALCGVVLVLGLARGEPTELMLVTAVSLAVAAVPESLPAVVTLSLAMGARRMAARSAVVRHLPAVETLGSVTVLATDKTGTLTQAHMVVEEVWTPHGSYQVSDDETPVGFMTAGHRVDVDAAPDLRRLLTAGALSNDATLAPDWEMGVRPGLGDPTEVALLVAAAKAGVTRPDAERCHPRIDEVPFDHLTKHMTTIHAVRGENGLKYVIRKGSPEALAARQPGDPQWRTALCQAQEFARRGFRVLAIEAGRVADSVPEDTAPMRLLGLVAMADPAKSAASSTIAECHRAGITTVLITGDHPATALSIARQVGVVTEAEAADPDMVATGDQIESGAVPDLTMPRVFARTRPEQKLQIVAAWQEHQAVVAMTGDGVNDGPALRRADIGVAMGHRGTEVARQAADMVLADDELATVGHAVEEGRRVYTNIRKFLLFGLSGGAAEILLMLVGPFTRLGVPLLAAQILWVNLLTHGLTGVAIGAEPADADAMNRPPRPPGESVLGGGLWQRVLAVGGTITVASLSMGLWAHASGRPWQSMTFVSLTCMQLGVALGLRPRPFNRQNPSLLLAVTASFTLVLAGVYIPVLQVLLSTQPLSLADAALAAVSGVVGALAVRVAGRKPPKAESRLGPRSSSDPATGTVGSPQSSRGSVDEPKQTSVRSAP